MSQNQGTLTKGKNMVSNALQGTKNTIKGGINTTKNVTGNLIHGTKNTIQQGTNVVKNTTTSTYQTTKNFANSGIHDSNHYHTKTYQNSNYVAPNQNYRRDDNIHQNYVNNTHDGYDKSKYISEIHKTHYNEPQTNLHQIKEVKEDIQYNNIPGHDHQVKHDYTTHSNIIEHPDFKLVAERNIVSAHPLVPTHPDTPDTAIIDHFDGNAFYRDLDLKEVAHQPVEQKIAQTEIKKEIVQTKPVHHDKPLVNVNKEHSGKKIYHVSELPHSDKKVTNVNQFSNVGTNYKDVPLQNHHQNEVDYFDVDYDQPLHQLHQQNQDLNQRLVQAEHNLKNTSVSQQQNIVDEISYLKAQIAQKNAQIDNLKMQNQNLKQSQAPLQQVIDQKNMKLKELIDMNNHLKTDLDHERNSHHNSNIKRTIRYDNQPIQTNYTPNIQNSSYKTYTSYRKPSDSYKTSNQVVTNRVYKQPTSSFTKGSYYQNNQTQPQTTQRIIRSSLQNESLKNSSHFRQINESQMNQVNRNLYQSSNFVKELTSFKTTSYKTIKRSARKIIPIDEFNNANSSTINNIRLQEANSQIDPSNFKKYNETNNNRVYRN